MFLRHTDLMVVTNRRRNKCLELVFHIAEILGPEVRHLDKVFEVFLKISIKIRGKTVKTRIISRLSHSIIFNNTFDYIFITNAVIN